MGWDPPNPLRAVLFDLDGTLVDAFADIAAAANHVRMGMGLPPLTVDEVKLHVGHGARRLVAGVTGLALGTPELEFQFSILLEFYRQNPASLAKPFPGTFEVLSSLRNAGVALAVCTNKPHGVTIALLEQLGMLDMFQCVLGEQPGLPAKPDPAMVYRALDQLGVSPSQALFVGDSPVDIATAREASLSVVVLSHGAHSADELSQYAPDLILPDFSQFLSSLIPISR
jgi:phosphoglycolate phosphatase